MAWHCGAGGAQDPAGAYRSDGDGDEDADAVGDVAEDAEEEEGHAGRVAHLGIKQQVWNCLQWENSLRALRLAVFGPPRIIAHLK